MNNLRKTIEILFKRKNPAEVIKEYCSENIKNEYFKAEMEKEKFLSYFELHKNEDAIYNGDEIKNVYSLYGEIPLQETIFSLLLKFSNYVLIQENNLPVCRYESLFRWRDLSFQLGEDLLTTSFLANQDLNRIQERTFFAWKPVIGNNNIRLKQILKKGVAENHFHLKGSGTHFNISWIFLMNNINKIDEKFQNLSSLKKLQPRIEFEFLETAYDLKQLIKVAAAIRYFLYKIFYRENILEEELLQLKGDLNRVLESNTLFQMELGKINSKIEIEKQLNGKKFKDEIPDYCILNTISEENYVDKSATVLLCGERLFLYKIFKKIYSHDEQIMKYEKLFYAYILIKQQFRDELIQVNRRVGFKNFSDYQDRKTNFVSNNSIYEKAIINSAVNSSLNHQNIVTLEARIAPKSKSKDLKKEIKNLDKIIENDIFSYKGADLEKIFLNQNNMQREYKYFYAIHYIKIADKIYYKETEKEILTQNCRNKKLRENVMKQTIAIEKSISLDFLQNRRIFGIDSANVEIGCRPEVFSLAYRYLKYYENGINSLVLGRSFHVGEEFLDIVDGLRAIDECIKFLNFDQGDRLGHALALGISPLDYYESKDLTLIISKQDLLDNIAWTLGKIREKGLDVSSSLMYYLENEYRKYYHEIYEKSSYELEGFCYITYYDSWKLRGDCPELYKEVQKLDEFQKMKIQKADWIRLNEGNEFDIARGNSKAKMLYREYHFNSKIKIEGSKIAEFKINYEYIKLVKELQKVLQKEIASKNICIETNPSSNYLIGTFNRYNEHPITKFYNLGLTLDSEKVKKCPQISVSINTDDQGVFGTYLENEYALIALSLEKQIDENGAKTYIPSMIYDWIDRVREMGLEQSFYGRD